jgi:hypothetical protein
MVPRRTGTRVRRLSLIAIVALVGATLASGTVNAVAAGRDRFQASGAVTGAAEGAELHSLLDFEQAAAGSPMSGSQSLFSRCRFSPFAGNVNFYSPLQSWEHDVIVDDTTTTFADGTSCFNPQNEQNIVVNPTNPLNIVTSANDYRFGSYGCWAYVTMDGGATWQDVVIPGWTSPTGGSGLFAKSMCGGDPALAFAPDGTLYYSGVTWNFDKFPRTLSGVAVSSSNDGGLTWSAPSMVHYEATGTVFNDKPWISVGNDGTVYETWTKFYLGPKGLGYIRSPIVMASSRNGGKSWSSVKEVSDPAHPYTQGSQVAQAPDGALYVTYNAASPSSGYNTDALVVARSTNGGRTWATSEVARIYDDLDCYPIQEPGAQDRPTLTNEQFRMMVNPSLAIDPTNGTLAVSWADDQGAGTCGQGGTTFSGVTSNQVKLITSADGTNWSSVRTITSTSADKAYPSVGANAGVISVGYFTRDYSPVPTSADRSCGIMERDSVSGSQVLPTDPVRAAAAVCLDWAVKTSADNFGTQVRVTSQSSNPYILFAGGFIGDYTGTAVTADGDTVTAWTDSRGNPGTTSPNQDTLVSFLSEVP